MIDNTIKIVIGSWGSYNACNEKALGSKWLNLSDYTTWEEITDELKREGFDLNGIDEELFIQDVMGIPTDSADWDTLSPKTFFEIIRDSEILEYEYKYEEFSAYIEVRNFDDFITLVEEKCERWDDGINVYAGYDWEDYGRETFFNCGYSIPDGIIDYFDFAAYGESMKYDGVEEYSGGLIEIFK